MDKAKSLYLGGQQIHATDPTLSSYSYRDLGLRCIYCGEPVYYRRGHLHQPHFAHFPELDPQKYEKCLLRQRGEGSVSEQVQSWWENSDQRFHLFQAHFVYIIKTEVPELDVTPLYEEPQETNLSELQTQTLKLACENKNGFLMFIRLFGKSSVSLEREIVCEAFDYLTKISSKNIFKAISNFLVKATEVPSKEGTVSSLNLCSKIIALLERISWMRMLTAITGTTLKQKSTSFHKPDYFIRNVSTEERSYICIYKGEIRLFKVDLCLIKEWTLLGKVDYGKIASSRFPLEKHTRYSIDSDLEEIFDIRPISDDLYKKHQIDIEESLIPKLTKFLKNHLRDSNSIEYDKFLAEGKLFIDCSINDLLKRKAANIKAGRQLRRNSKNAKIARIYLKKSALHIDEFYTFGEFLMLSDEYHSTRQKNPFIEEVVLGIVQELHTLFSKAAKQLQVARVHNGN